MKVVSTSCRKLIRGISMCADVGSEMKPQLVVFDLDYTLWPFWVDTHVTPPFSKKSDGGIVDAHGSAVRHYPESPAVLEHLQQQGHKIGVASRTGEIKGAKQLIQLFGWEKYFTYTQIYPGNKTTHFKRLQQDSGVKQKDMLFFDDEQRNIADLKRVGVTSILVKKGMSMKYLEEGLKAFAQNSRS